MAQDTIPLFLDCDPGIDDAIAIAYLLCQPDVDLIGLAASGGNVSTTQVVANTLGWLELAGRSDLPVFRGAVSPLGGVHVLDALAAEADPAVQPGVAVSSAPPVVPETASVDPATAPVAPEYAEVTHGDTGAGYAVLPTPRASAREQSAAEAWVAAARAHPGELIGVVIGPSTNLALALEIEPDLPRLVKRLFIMGGAFNYRGNTRPTTEWNVTFDPEAAARVFRAFGDAFVTGAAPFAPVIGPIEATEMVEMTPERLQRILSGAEAAAGAEWHATLHQLGEALRFYFEFHEADGHGYLAHIHDPFVVAVAVGWARQRLGAPLDSRESTDAVRLPWAESACAPVDVELTGSLTRGETVADWLGRWNRPANAEIIRRVDAAGFLDHLTETLMKGPHHERTR